MAKWVANDFFYKKKYNQHWTDRKITKKVPR